MDIFSFITMLGGLAFFLYGMQVMSSGLEKLVGSKLESVLKSMTSNRIKGFVLGAAITAIIQSSSAVTVMLVGLVNSGIMRFSQTIGVIMGTNIGTTITAWILSLTGIEGESLVLSLLKPEAFAPVFALIGVILITFVKSNKKNNIGQILVGFALLMSGMTMMSNAMKPLAEMPEFRSILTMFSNPIFGILTGLVITAIIQSSSASVGILQSIATTGSLTFGAAIPIIMGQNIGTCITSVISSFGANKNAKRVTVVHVLFNIIGTVVFMTLYYVLNAFMKFAFSDLPINAVWIAVIHSLFNVLTTLLLFPFGNQLEKLAEFIIKDRKDVAVEYSLLDDRLLLTPSFAIAECRNVAANMAKIAKTSLLSSIDLISKYNQRVSDEITEGEEQIDLYEDKLGSFLVKLSGKSLNQSDSNEVSELLHCIGDFERIGDHAINLLEVANEIHEKHLAFSPDAKQELTVIGDAIRTILSLTYEAFEKNDSDLAGQVEPLEQVIDDLILDLKSRHVRRLQSGKCTIELGFVLSDILNNYERVSDHCSNIAVYVIQLKDSVVNAHEYLSELRVDENNDFMSAYHVYKEQYQLPKRTNGAANPASVTSQST